MRTRKLLQGVAILALSAAAVGCARTPVGNVVVILIDQLRWDSSQRHMQQVNALGEQGIVFEGMRAAAPWTYPSVISLMSGLYPQQHGADGHATDNILSQFDPEVPLLQKRLRASGYATAAFVTNSFLLEWNVFHEGFDHFDGQFVHSQGPFRGHERVWIPERMFADSVNEEIRAWFDANAYERPEFTYVHYIDAHGPWNRAPFPDTYQDAIRYVDRHVAALYRYFMERYNGDVIFVVTSDHGRALGDDVHEGAGPKWRKQKHSVHDYNVRIPFLILPSAWVTQARRIPGPCSNVDVAPTILGKGATLVQFLYVTGVVAVQTGQIGNQILLPILILMAVLTVSSGLHYVYRGIMNLNGAHG